MLRTDFRLIISGKLVKGKIIDTVAAVGFASTAASVDGSYRHGIDVKKNIFTVKCQQLLGKYF